MHGRDSYREQRQVDLGVDEAEVRVNHLREEDRKHKHQKAVLEVSEEALQPVFSVQPRGSNRAHGEGNRPDVRKPKQQQDLSAHHQVLERLRLGNQEVVPFVKGGGNGLLHDSVESLFNRLRENIRNGFSFQLRKERGGALLQRFQEADVREQGVYGVANKGESQDAHDRGHDVEDQRGLPPRS